MTYEESVQFLYNLRLAGAKLGLDNTRILAQLAGNPQDQLAFIHVAGTNGKGSVCAMLESIYRHTGLKVGMYTSPHLVSFCERFQINRVPISREQIVQRTAKFEALLPQIESHRPTFFEVTTVMALDYFASEKCDLVVWETGLGGRLDSTNIVLPLASLITNIQLDHERWLGNSLTQIAVEKAGIIKPGIPVLTTTQNPEALELIRNRARELNCPFEQITTDSLSMRLARECSLSLPGSHQITNAALALATVQQLSDRWPVSEPSLKEALHRVSWPGRLQSLTAPDGCITLIDGAHNPDGIDCLCRHLTQTYPSEKFTFVMGALADKHWDAMIQSVAPLAERINLAPVKSERTADPHHLAAHCREQQPHLPTQVFTTLSEALAQSESSPRRVISGSLHFIGEALELLHLLPSSPEQDEKGLNDYTRQR